MHRKINVIIDVAYYIFSRLFIFLIFGLKFLNFQLFIFQYVQNQRKKRRRLVFLNFFQLKFFIL